MPTLAGFLAALQGQTIDGKYRLVKLRGIGGFGAVFEAEERIADTVTRPRLAVKVMFRDDGASRRQLDELSLATTVDHANIVRCHAPGLCQMSLGNEPVDLLYLVMELADATLDERMLQGYLPLETAIGLARELADALVYLHARKIVHRDLKPSNVLFLDGHWKLGDLGIFRYLGDQTSAVTAALGVYSYMPPEAFDGEVSTAWDVWSLGATLLEAVTGRLPYYASTVGEYIYLAKTQEPEIPGDILEPLGGIIRGCLLKDRSVRPTAPQLREMLLDRPRKPLDIGAGAVLVGGAASQYATLVDAVTKVRPGTRIVVRPGVYAGTVHLTRRLEIHGLGSVADVVIDGQGGPSIVADGADCVVRGVTLRSDAGHGGGADGVVEVRSGRLLVDFCDISGTVRACMSSRGPMANPTIRRSRLRGGRDAGASFGKKSQGLLEDCEVVRCGRSGVWIGDDANPVVKRCRIRDGQKRGILVSETGLGVVEECDISRNHEHGIELAKGCDVIVRRCRISANGGAGIHVGRGARAAIRGCRLIGNAKGGWQRVGQSSVDERDNVEEA